MVDFASKPKPCWLSRFFYSFQMLFYLRFELFEQLLS